MAGMNGARRAGPRTASGAGPRAPSGAGRNWRLLLFRLLVVVVFLVMVGQLLRLQRVRGEFYQQAADVNRFRLERVAAPRGVIYDRRGRLLVRNLPRLTVSIVPAYLPEEEPDRLDLLRKLSELVDVPLHTPQRPRPLPAPGEPDTEPGLLEIVEQAELAPYRPAPVKDGIPREVALRLEEEHLDWPGVLVEVEPVREYLDGPTTAHVLGFVGPIPAGQADDYEARGYDPNRDRVGLTGVEYSFEDQLRGEDGQKLIEVDVAGREVRTVGEPQPAVPGDNLRLTLDMGLQQASEQILKEHLKPLGKRQAAVVALNPQTGEVLALVSLPAYDNNQFTGGISLEALQALQKDADRPLVDHAISGMFPPGSTFKMMVASAGLEEGVISSDTRLNCGGILWLPNRFYPEDPGLAQPFYCWIQTKYHGSHGSENVISALGHSCDIFFYQVGGGYRSYFEGLGVDRLGHYAELFGLGAPTGIDLPGEAPGLVPTPKWKRENYRETWTTGDTYNMSIGQGFVLATPLQMVNVAAAVANGGTLYRPQIVREVLGADGSVVRAFSPEVLRTIPVSAANLATLRQGMRAVVAGAGATAYLLDVPGVAVAGKTGTSEFFIDRNNDRLPDRDKEGHLPTHAWFVAFAPYDKPEIALVVFVFGGGEGSGTAVPIASDILNYYFGQDKTEETP
jgi:penicillin-binding protein 2